MQSIPPQLETPPLTGERFAYIGFDNLEVGRYYYIVLRDIDLVDNYLLGKITESDRVRDGRTLGFRYEIHSDYVGTPPHWESQNPPAPGHITITRSMLIRPDAQTNGVMFYKDITLGGKRRRKTRRGGKRHRRKTTKK
jgi:hypothetical protein